LSPIESHPEDRSINGHESDLNDILPEEVVDGVKSSHDITTDITIRHNYELITMKNDHAAEIAKLQEEHKAALESFRIEIAEMRKQQHEALSV